MTKLRKGEIGALLFDLDGTLVDSAPDLAAALNRLLAEEGRPALALSAIKTMVGDGVAKLVERGFAAHGGPPVGTVLEHHTARFVAHYEAALTVETRPFDGVIETLSSLQRNGWRLGVCTNKPEAATRQVLEDLALAGFIEALAGGDSFAVRKPHPGHLLGVLEQLRVEPGAAVMVGDSRNDVSAARNAGLPVILVSYGYGDTPARDLGADLVIDHFAALPEALAALGLGQPEPPRIGTFGSP